MPHHTDDATGTSQTPHCCAPKNTSGGTHGACQATRLTFSAQGPNRLCSAGLRVWHLGVEPHVAHLADDLWVPLGSCPVPCQAERQCSFFAAMNHSICSLSHMHSRMLYTLSSRTQCSNSEPAPMTQTCCTAASMTHRTWHDQKLRPSPHWTLHAHNSRQDPTLLTMESVCKDVKCSKAEGALTCG